MRYKFVNGLVVLFMVMTFVLNADDEIGNDATINDHMTNIDNMQKNDDYKNNIEENNVENITDSVNDTRKSLTDNVYGHIGFFGKSNALNKQYKDDNYGVFSGSVGLKYTFNNDFTSKISLNLGVYVMTDLYKSDAPNKYVESKFITHNVFLNIKDSFYELTMGRYKGNRDWIKHYVQGVSINATYSWFNLWGEWIDNQAYVNREYINDFNIFQKRYSGEWLIATGIETDFYGVNISPYYYFFNKNFWATGIKLGFATDIADGWGSKTLVHYAYLKSKVNGIYGNTNTYTSKIAHNGASSIVWIDQEINYRFNNNDISSNVLFGLGFIKTFDDEFELARIGNMSRFETSDYRSYNVIETGGLNNGYNSANTFYGNTNTFYGFTGFRINNFSMMILGRDSRSTEVKQQSYSIGGKYKIVNGFYAGGLVSYMVENDRNKSFAKAYVEFVI